jgi:hypothetical protein
MMTHAAEQLIIIHTCLMGRGVQPANMSAAAQSLLFGPRQSPRQASPTLERREALRRLGLESWQIDAQLAFETLCSQWSEPGLFVLDGIGAFSHGTENALCFRLQAPDDAAGQRFVKVLAARLGRKLDFYPNDHGRRPSTRMYRLDHC